MINFVSIASALLLLCICTTVHCAMLRPGDIATLEAIFKPLFAVSPGLETAFSGGDCTATGLAKNPFQTSAVRCEGTNVVAINFTAAATVRNLGRPVTFSINQAFADNVKKLPNLRTLVLDVPGNSSFFLLDPVLEGDYSAMFLPSLSFCALPDRDHALRTPCCTSSPPITPPPSHACATSFNALTGSTCLSCCRNGIKDGGETLVDCGGRLCDACPTSTNCDNGIRDAGEGGVDCGGTSNCDKCCDNGVQDDGEAGRDCGGPCKSCPNCRFAADVCAVHTQDACNENTCTSPNSSGCFSVDCPNKSCDNRHFGWVGAFCRPMLPLGKCSSMFSRGSCTTTVPTEGECVLAGQPAPIDLFRCDVQCQKMGSCAKGTVINGTSNIATHCRVGGESCGNGNKTKCIEGLCVACDKTCQVVAFAGAVAQCRPVINGTLCEGEKRCLGGPTLTQGLCERAEKLTLIGESNSTFTSADVTAIMRAVRNRTIVVSSPALTTISNSSALSKIQVDWFVEPASMGPLRLALVNKTFGIWRLREPFADETALATTGVTSPVATASGMPTVAPTMGPPTPSTIATTTTTSTTANGSATTAAGSTTANDSPTTASSASTGGLPDANTTAFSEPTSVASGEAERREEE